jgi:hypothetical protein
VKVALEIILNSNIDVVAQVRMGARSCLPHVALYSHCASPASPVRMWLAMIVAWSCFAKVRWATCTAKFLRRYRRALSLEIPWRSLYNLLRTLHFENSTSYQVSFLCSLVNSGQGAVIARETRRHTGS